ncbi:BON domain-containing protein [Noviherbaspirillum sedimenti]|nr:BON domain-containing protein [Noviherbaspirillum sedimenti]
MNKTSHLFKSLFFIIVFGAAISGCERRAADQPGSESMSSGASESSSASGSYGNGSLTQRAERGIEDSVITTKAKTALLADTTVKGTDIHVETNKGVVSLSGMVDTERQRERAASIVKGIDGVSSVDNKMTVKQ